MAPRTSTAFSRWIAGGRALSLAELGGLLDCSSCPGDMDFKPMRAAAATAEETEQNTQHQLGAVETDSTMHPDQRGGATLQQRPTCPKVPTQSGGACGDIGRLDVQWEGP